MGCGWAAAGPWLVCGWSLVGLWLGLWVVVCASGRLLASRSISQASEKHLIRVHETHTFGRDLRNRSFRLRERHTFRTPSPHIPSMTQVRLAQRHPRKLTVQICVRTSAVECDFFTSSEKNSPRNGITKQNTFALDSSLRGNQGQAGPGRASPSRASLVWDAGSGRLPASCSSWQASEKQLIR